MEIETKKQWHPVFCAAVELEFREDKDILTYEREYNLSKKPLQIDLLIIKKEPKRQLKNEIGDFFLEHNLLEYKSPGDSLNLATFYKVLGYACLYKYDIDSIDELLDTNITISLLREEKPVKLLKQLSDKYSVVVKAPGIYRFQDTLFPLQILVTKELTLEMHTWLCSLTRSMEYGNAEQLLHNYGGLEDTGDRKNANVIVDFVSNVNEALFTRILKEDARMTEALKELIAPELVKLRSIIQDKDLMLASQNEKLTEKDAEIASLRQKLEEAMRASHPET